MCSTVSSRLIVVATVKQKDMQSVEDFWGRKISNTEVTGSGPPEQLGLHSQYGSTGIQLSNLKPHKAWGRPLRLTMTKRE